MTPQEKDEVLSNSIVSFNDRLKDIPNRKQLRNNFEDQKISIYKYAVENAYLDAKRAIKIGKNLKIQNLLDNLASQLEDYFKNTNIDIVKLKKQQEKMRKSFCYNTIPIYYGFAQKVVNLSFKYLYCDENFRKKHDVRFFEVCDMTIDSYILRWYKKRVEKAVKGKSGFKDPKVKSNSAWSKLDNGKYVGIQDNIELYIRNHFSNNLMSRFEYEIIIWPYLLVYEAYLNLIKSLSSNKKRERGMKKYVDLINEANIAIKDYDSVESNKIKKYIDL